MPTKLSLVAVKAPSALVTAVEDYISASRARGLSPRTVKYGLGFPLREIFLPWCADNQIVSPEQLDSRTLTRFQSHLEEHGGKEARPLKRWSIHSYEKSVKGFLAWLKAEGEKVGDIRLPRQEQRIVQTLTPKEIDRLEAAATSTRDAIIVRLLAETGIRRAECAGLKVKDLLEEGGRHYLLV